VERSDGSCWLPGAVGFHRAGQEAGAGLSVVAHGATQAKPLCISAGGSLLRVPRQSHLEAVEHGGRLVWRGNTSAQVHKPRGCYRKWMKMNGSQDGLSRDRSHIESALSRPARTDAQAVLSYEDGSARAVLRCYDLVRRRDLDSEGENERSCLEGRVLSRLTAKRRRIRRRNELKRQDNDRVLAVRRRPSASQVPSD
jgi:hypothetical protein